MKKIKLNSVRPDIDYSKPVPASKMVPEWFRKIPGVINGQETIKKCVPFIDAMTSGYMVTLAADIYVDGSGIQQISKDSVVLQHYDEQIGDIKLPYEYSRQPYKWMNMFIGKTPKGYSTLFTHPFNRFDLPFYTMTGVVDTDKFPLQVNFPFFIRKDFVGLIPAGTPVAQAFPFKREDWQIEVDDTSPYEPPAFSHTMHNPPFGYYKKNFWSRKKYS